MGNKKTIYVGREKNSLNNEREREKALAPHTEGEVV